MSANNSRFRTAVHALTVIAYLPDQVASSDSIAASVATDATVVRRLLASLRNAGLVHVLAGRAGGYALARPAHQITLADVFAAVNAEPLFPMPDRAPNPDCPVGANIHQVLDGPLRQARDALETRLAQTTLAQVLTMTLTV